MVNKESVLCPSAECEEGAILLGIVQREGHISFVSEKIIADKEFVQIARKGRNPRKRFRFSNHCVTSACSQWTNSRCGVIDKVIEILEPQCNKPELPSCSIRKDCRWFMQRGASACHVCPYVITDLNLYE